VKILYVVGAYGRRYNANEIHRELLLEFARRGHACIVFAGVTPGELGDEPISYHDGSIDVQRMLIDTRGRHRVAAELGRRIFHYPRFLPLIWGVRELLRRHPDIDVIHADAVYPIGAIVALAATHHPAAIVPSIHGGDLMNYPGYGYGAYRSARQLIRATFKRSVMVRVNSPLMAAHARALGCPIQKLRQILVNIGDRFFQEPAPLADRRATAGTAVRRKHNLDPDAPLLLGTGRLLPLKGFIDTIAAMREVAHTYPKARLIIAGPNIVDPLRGDQRAALQAAIVRYGVAKHVHVREGLDYETEMLSYLQAADLLVAPAHIEGLNRVVAEAGTQGTPSIVSTMTGIAPLVRELEAGAVVEARNVDALAGAMCGLLDAVNDHTRYAANARRLAQRFRSVVIADALLDLYQTAYERGRHQPNII
jgi:phosphatidylinositol alpha-1,6-mannosyltransferase